MTVSKVLSGTALAVALIAGGSIVSTTAGTPLVSSAHAETMASPVKFSSGGATIKYREAMMKAIGGHWSAIATTLKEGDSVGAIADHAAAVAALAKDLAPAFAEGSGPMDGDTNALPDIWEKKDDFAKVLAAFQTESAKLADVAKGGDKKAIAAQFGATGKASCKACHDGFKKKG